MLTTKLVVAWLIDGSEVMDEFFVRLVAERRYDDVIFLSDGLGREVPFETPLYEKLKRGDFLSALQIIEHCPCDPRNALAWILAEGADRLALHVALRHARFEEAVPHIVKRVLRKCDIFLTFSLAFRRVFARQALLGPLAQPPPALQFRNRMAATIEDATPALLTEGSKLDYPTSRIFSFSRAYNALLGQLRASLDTVEEDLPLPGCLQALPYAGGWLYLGRDGFPSFDAGGVDVAAIALHHSVLYAIDRRLRLYRSGIAAVALAPVPDAPPTLRVEANAERVAFLSVFGCVSLDDGRVFPGQYVDVALCRTALYALDAAGTVWRLSRAAPARVPLRCFAAAIAAAGDAVVCVASSRRCFLLPPGARPRELDLRFEPACVQSFGDTAVLVGHGHIAVVAEDGVTRLRYSDRIGTVLSVAQRGQDFVLCGSIGAPMLVLGAPIPSAGDAAFPEMQLIADAYPADLLLRLFPRDPWRAFVLVLARRFADLAAAVDVAPLAPHLGEMEPDAAVAVVHLLVQRGSAELLTPAVLQTPAARACLLRYPNDARLLAPEQRLAALPRVCGGGRLVMDSLTEQLLQSANHPTVVPSLRFKEGELLAFTCNHVWNQAEMQALVADLQRVCETARYPATGKYLAEIFANPPIPSVCPRCLQQQIAYYLREK